MAIKIDNKFKFEQIVFLKTDSEQLERIVLYYVVHPNYITYGLAHGTEISEHYDFEIVEDKILF